MASMMFIYSWNRTYKANCISFLYLLITCFYLSKRTAENLPKKLYFCTMNLLAEHTERLLLQYDCVIVPKLGGFVIQHREARQVLQTMLPPCSEIGFNPLLTHVDGLLAQSLMRTFNIDYAEAMRRIAVEVSGMQRQLRLEGFCVFGRIGSFMLNNGILEFHPADPGFLPDNLGLRPICLPEPLSTNNKSREVVLHIPVRRTLVRYAAAVALLCAFAWLSPNTKQHTQNAGFVHPAWMQHTLLMPACGVSTIDTPILSTTTIAAPIMPVMPIKEAHCHIVVASMPTEARAIAYCKSWPLAKGDTLCIIPAGSNFRVVCRSFVERRDAVTAMETARRNRPEMRNAWVWVE